MEQWIIGVSIILIAIEGGLFIKYYLKAYKYERWLKAMMKAVIKITEKDADLFQRFVAEFNKNKGE